MKKHQQQERSDTSVQGVVKPARKKSQVILPENTIKGQLTRDSSEEILNKHNIKRLSSWFHTWHSWQKRLLVCTVMNYCTKQQLAVLATSLEPILHMDFSSSLLPPLQSLHLDSVATFHVQRAVTKKLIQPEVPIPIVDSQPYLTSLPSTFNSDASSSDASFLGDLRGLSQPKREPAKPEKREPAKPEPPLLPVLPLTHPDHLPTPGLAREVSFNQLLDYRRQRFSSVPDFRSTTDLLKKYKKWGAQGRKSTGRTLLAKSKTISACNQALIWEQRTEQFKEQLGLVTNWMTKWDCAQKAHLLSELVKLCDKNLLGYFVQCLHQQLQGVLDVNSLPDYIMMRIFRFLSPKDLCTAAQVCKSWSIYANMAELWKDHAYSLGISEGVGDIGKVMETVIRHYRHSVTSDTDKEPIVDWKRAYRDLRKLVLNIKTLVVKSAEEEAREKDLQERLRASIKTPARNKLSLMEMLEILRMRCSRRSPTTHDLYRMAADSASTRRRQMRMEKFHYESRRRASSIKSDARSLTLSPRVGAMDVWTPTHNLEFAQHLMMTIKDAPHKSQQYYTLEKWELQKATSVKFLEKVIEVALDTRPRAPMLPDPDAIQCLVLSGGLLGTYTPKPGKINDVLNVRRIERMGSVVLCMQCDARKIVVGNIDRTVTVVDVRSGRTVSTLHGHKGSVQCLQFDDNKIVSGSWDTCCIVWDVVHYKPIKQLEGHTECVSCLQFDEDILVTGSHDGSLRMWSTSSWDTICISTSAHSGGVLCLKMNKTLFASGGVDKQVKLWSLSTRLCLKVLEQSAPVTALDLSHLLLTSCSIDGAVAFWSLDSLDQVMKMQTNNGAYLRQMVQFRNKYYGAGSDGVIYELDLSTGTCIRTLTGHSVIITALSLVDDKLLSTSADKTLVTWSIKTKVHSKSKQQQHRKKPAPEEEAEKLWGEEEGGEEEAKEEEDKEWESKVESSRAWSSVDVGDVKEREKEYHYKPPRFHVPFPMRVVVDDRPDCCGFEANNSDIQALD